jgi:hypothetical protein
MALEAGMSRDARRPDGSPGDRQQPLARAALAERRRRDAARVLPAAGVVLLASPLLDVAAGTGSLFGVPAGVLYIFAVWAGLILFTVRLSRAVTDREGRGE